MVKKCLTGAAIKAWRQKLAFDANEHSATAVNRWLKELVEAMASAGIPEVLLKEDLDEEPRAFVENEYSCRLMVLRGFVGPGQRMRYPLATPPYVSSRNPGRCD